ncbi:toll/interleukin-1 receptor domain-containing protein [Bacillus wiedmannii]|uniref:toll/interleukin-1 receptor domain-containing protein n=1 Tax=Bacillus wiedmannii TaxID=1890302 RepID=UPI002E1B6065|nr:toll/interleukin-1 receptor domain-containing protein [Bacillus wiedmannii]
MRKISISKISQEWIIKSFNHEEWHEDDGLSVAFIFEEGFPQREYLNIISNYTKTSKWLECERNTVFFNLDKIKQEYKGEFDDCTWMKGKIALEPEFDNQKNRVIVNFSATKEEIELNQPMKVFLSHKGADKDIVREYHKLFLELGFEPWLDEDAMAAGVGLERALLQGFKESCAVVFFITPNYVDDGYLATEIDYAISEHRSRSGKFSIISLLLPDEDGKRGTIPDLVQRFVCKKPENSLEAFKEIVRALPIKVGQPIWK